MREPSQAFKSCACFCRACQDENDRSDVCLECQRRTFAANQNALFQFRAQFRAQLADFRLFRATSYFCNILMYRELSWLRGRDLNPRPLGYEIIGGGY